MKKAMLWCLLLTKRLYKKVTYLVILALIPALVFGYTAMTQGDSGILTVALAQQAQQDTVSTIFDKLQGSSQLIRYVVCDSPAQAGDLVRTGKADAAWLFPADFQGAIADFVAKPTQSNAIVTVLEREDNVTLMLAREKLSGLLYEHLAQSLFLSHIRQENPQLPEMTDEEMLHYYLGTDISDELFTFDDAEAAANDTPSYLLTPVRGLLAVVITLCGLAAGMYYLHDSRSGTFAWVPERRKALPELGCQLVAVGNVAVVALVAMALAGLSQGLLTELATLVLYSLCVAGFCMLLRRVLGSIRALGTAIPLLVVVMLLVCPVFFDLAIMRLPQYLLPPTYYVNAVYNPMYLLYMLPYILITVGLSLLWDRLKTK